MEKKYSADNGLGNLFWVIMAFVLLGIFVYRVVYNESLWTVGLYFAFTVLFTLSVTIKAYVITDQNFLEIRYVLKLFSKNRRIAIGDIVGLKKEKRNQLRIDKVRGFEVIRVKEKDMDALIGELKERNPRIRMPEGED